MSPRVDLNELARLAAETEIERLHAGERAGAAIDEADVAAVKAREANEKLRNAVEQAKADERVRLTNGRGSRPQGRFYDADAPSETEEPR